MGTTQELASFVTEKTYSDLPPQVVEAAKRAVINLLGTAIYSASDPSLAILRKVFADEGGKGRATIWGTGERTTLQNAALANGYLAHLEDYDDTHFPTVLHPSAPTVPAAFAIAEHTGASGRDVLTAIALGMEAACRISMAVHPWHYDEGWHITGTMGVFGGAVAAGRLLGLDRAQMTACLGIAGTQGAGVREVFGTMTKAMHPGRAAQAGVLAALLAAEGFTSTTQILEGRRGVAAVASPQSDLGRVTDGLGNHWEIYANGLKPYACGVVNHPLIDACKRLRSRVDLAQVETIEAQVHPLVLELVNLPDPREGLQGKFSVQHCIAIGLKYGSAHPAQFSDAVVRDPEIAALRRKVTLVKDDEFGEDEATVRVIFVGGGHDAEHVFHATGAPDNPMSDEELNEKFLALAGVTLGATRVQTLLDRLWRLDEAENLALILA